jgi:hypothetical protein
MARAYYGSKWPINNNPCGNSNCSGTIDGDVTQCASANANSSCAGNRGIKQHRDAGDTYTCDGSTRDSSTCARTNNNSDI